jgi:hypothetical protein
VIHGDVRDDGKLGPNDVGGIEPASHADLKDGDIHPAAGKMNKGKSRCKFEVGDSLAICPAKLPDEFAEGIFGDHGSIDPDAFPEIDKVGGRVQPNPVAGCLEDCCEGRRNGTFSVGASHKNAFTAFLGTP